jgi:hypothetical protein
VADDADSLLKAKNDLVCNYYFYLQNICTKTHARTAGLINYLVTLEDATQETWYEVIWPTRHQFFCVWLDDRLLSIQ